MNAAANQGTSKKVDKKKLMEKAFALLKSQGKNSVEGIFKYLKERKLLDDGTEKLVKQALTGLSDPKNMDYSKFAEVCQSVAKEKGIDAENLTKKIAKSLFGDGNTAGSSSKAPGDGGAGTSGSARAYQEIFEDDEDFDFSDNHHDSTDEHHDSTDEHHDSTDEHHESTDDHDSSSDHQK